MAIISRDTVQVKFTAKDDTKSGLESIKKGVDSSLNRLKKFGSELRGLGRGKSGVKTISSDMDKAKESIDDAAQSIEGLQSKGNRIDDLVVTVDKLSDSFDKVESRLKSTVAGIGSFITGTAAVIGNLAEVGSFLSDSGLLSLIPFLDKSTSSVGRLFTAVSVLRNPLFAAAAGMTFFSAASAAFARDLTIASERTTLGTEKIQEFSFQLSQLASGVDLEDLQETLLNISERFGEASKDAGAIRDALQAIGLSQSQIVDLNFAGPEAQLQAIRESFQGLATDSERIFRARELFAEDGLRTLQFITAAQQDLDDLAQRSVELGLVVPDAVLTDLSNLTKEYKVFGNLAENTAIEVGSIFSKVSTESFGLLNDLYGLIGGPRGLGIALRTLTFPIVKPMEIFLKGSRLLVGIYNNLFRIISQRIVGSIKDAGSATSEWLEELGKSSGIRDAASGLEKSFAKTALRIKKTAAEFKLLNENLPDTEIDRLVKLVFDLEQGLAGSDEKALALKISLRGVGDESAKLSENTSKLINNLSGIDSEIKAELKVEPTGLEEVQNFQDRIDAIKKELESDKLSLIDREQLESSLKVSEQSLSKFRKREQDALEERRKDFKSNFDDITRIELDAERNREQLRELFSGNRTRQEQDRYRELIKAINQGEAEALAALNVTTEDPAVAAAEKANRDKAEAARREREQQQSTLTQLRSSYDQRFAIENDARQKLASLETVESVLTVDAEVKSNIVAAIEQEKRDSIAALDKAQAELKSRAFSIDILNSVNTDSVNDIESAIQDIRDAAQLEKIEIRDAVKVTAISEQQKQEQLAKVESTANELFQKARDSFNNAQQELSFNAGRFDILGSVNVDGIRDLPKTLQAIRVAVKNESAQISEALEFTAISPEAARQQKARLSELASQLQTQAVESLRETRNTLKDKALDLSSLVNIDTNNVTDITATLKKIQDAAKFETVQIKDAIKITAISNEQRQIQLARIDQVASELREKARQAFLEKQEELSFDAGRFDILGSVNIDGIRDLPKALRDITVAARNEAKQISEALEIRAITPDQAREQTDRLAEFTSKLQTDATESFRETSNALKENAFDLSGLVNFDTSNVTDITAALKEITDAAQIERVEIKDAINVDVISDEQKQAQLTKIDETARELGERARVSFAEQQQDLSFESGRFDSLESIDIEAVTDLPRTLQSIRQAVRAETQEISAALGSTAITPEDAQRQRDALAELTRDLNAQAVESSISTRDSLRSEAFDLGELVKIDTNSFRSVSEGAEAINAAFRQQLKEANLSAVLSKEEQQKVIAEAAKLKAQLDQDLVVDVKLNTQIDSVQSTLGNVGTIAGALGTLQNSGVEDDSEARRIRDEEIKAAQEELVAAKESGDAREIASAQNKITQLSALQKKEEAQAKKRFNAYKKTQKAIAIVSTISAGVQVFQETKGDLFTKLAGMAAALAAGYAQVKAIDRQSFQSSSIGGTSSGGGGGSSSNVSNDQVRDARQDNVTTRRGPAQIIQIEGDGGLSADALDDLAEKLNNNAANGGVQIIRTGT